MAVEFYKEFGNLGYLANYSHHGFYKDGVFYKTAEHYYQASKFNDLEIKYVITDHTTNHIFGMTPKRIRMNLISQHQC